MDRRAFIGSLTGGLLAPPLAAEAQQRGQIPRVGILHPGSPPQSPIIEGLREGLRELGYVEGQTIAIEYRWASGNPEALPELAAELNGLKVDVIVAVTLPAAYAARDAAGPIPIVVSDLQTDPVAHGLVASFARPGGQFTGLFLDLPGLAGKWLELLREAAPVTRRVAVLWDSTTGDDQLNALKRPAKLLGMELQVLEVRSARDYDRVLTSVPTGRPQALVQLSSPRIQQVSNRVADFALKYRLPAISMFRSFTNVGGLMAFGPNLVVFFRRSATYVHRILQGAKPGDLPVEQPTKFELVINLKTAKALRLTIPPSLLQRADQVIE